MSSIGSIDDEVAGNSFGAVPITDPKKRRKCPLCKQNLCLYNLNYEEMMLMCENVDCDYPFGYEALQIVTNECELKDKPDPATEEFLMYATGESIPSTMDTVSTSSFFLAGSFLSELDRHNLDTDFTVTEDNIYEDSQSDQLKQKSLKRKKRKNKEIEKNLNSIKRLNTEMSNLSKHFDTQITSQKWLNNLQKWEASSGKKLLKEEEVIHLEKNQPAEEVKISFDSQARLPVVNIEIFKKR